jgi:alanine dehydrogenase
MMTIGICRTSLKENERRVPIYPSHLPRYSGELRTRMVFERDYGKDYGVPDEYITSLGARIAGRDEIVDGCDIVVLPKPVPADLARMHRGQVVFGWAHCVQQSDMTQLAIDRRLTVIAWEAMNHWSPSGDKLLHVFYKNNEIAGYAAALHSLQLLGRDGHYGPRRRVTVLGYGSVARGAIYALQGRGFNNIHVFTRRSPHLVADQNPDVYYGQYLVGPDGLVTVRTAEGDIRSVLDELVESDIVCNGVLQDPTDPVMFVRDTDVAGLKPKSLIIDISCDLGMGFAFARPTSFADPVFSVGPQVTYYSVDHTPSYLWDAASREISKVLLQYLQVVAEGRPSWTEDVTVRRAVEILNGVVQNPAILKFQNRRAEYPHSFDVP